MRIIVVLAVFLVLMPSIAAITDAELNNNTVAYWRFDDTYADENGQFDLTNNGMTFDTGKTNSAAYGQSGDYLNGTRVDLSTGELSVFGWMKIDTSVKPQIISQRDGSSINQFQFQGATDFTAGYLILWGTPSAQTAQTPTGYFVNGTWTHYGFTFDGSTVKFYKNGAEISSSSEVVTLDNTAGSRININRDHYTNYGKAWFDEMAVYNESLTAEKVSALYNETNAGRQYVFTTGSPANDTINFSSHSRSTSAGGSTDFAIFVESTESLSNVTFYLDNGTGTYAQFSSTNPSATSTWSNHTTNINATNGATIRYYWSASDGNLTENSSTYTFDIYVTPTGTMNWTRYPSNPVRAAANNDPMELSGSVSGESNQWIYNGTVFALYRSSNSTPSPVYRILLTNSTDAINWGNRTNLTGQMPSATFQQPQVQRRGDTLYLMGVDLTHDYLWVLNASISNPYNWTQMCGGPIITYETSREVFNPAFDFDGDGNVHLYLEEKNGGQFYLNYYNATSICGPYTDGGNLHPNAGNAWLKRGRAVDNSSDVWVMVTGNISTGDWTGTYFRGTEPWDLTLVENTILGGGQESWETSPYNSIADFDIMVWTEDHNITLPYKTVMYYNGGQVEDGFAYDTMNRSIEEVFNFTIVDYFSVEASSSDTEITLVTIEVDQSRVGSGIPISWNVSATGGDSPITWQVAPGDGSANSTSTSGTFTYASAGNYTITATATDADGDTLSNTTVIEVLGPVVFLNSNATLVEDSYTAGSPQDDTNYGSSSNLAYGYGTPKGRVWLKFSFNLSDYTNITNAKLVLNRTDAIIGTERLYISTGPNTWNESTLTFNNEPCGTAGVPNASCTNLSTVTDSYTGVNEYDVTSWLEARRAAGDTEGTLMIWTDVNDGIFQSSESGGFTPTLTFTGQLNTSLTFNVYYEENLSSFTDNVTITFIKRVDENNPVYTEYTIEGGSLSIEDYEIGPYDILYNRSGYVKKWHYLDITGLDNVTVSLYMKNETDGENTSIFVRDGKRDPISGAIVKAQRYYNGTGWVTIDMIETDTAGQADLNLNRGFTYYKFLVQDDDETILTSERTLILQDSYYFNQQSNAGSIDGYETIMRTDSRIKVQEYGNGTKYAAATFNQLDGQTKNYTLTVKRRTSSGTAVVTSTSTSSSGGTLTASFPTTAGSYYAELTSNDGLHSIADYESKLSAAKFGAQGPLIGLFVTMSFALLGAFNLVAGLTLGIVGLVLSFAMGWLSIGVGSLVSIVIMVLIIMFGGSRR